MPRTIENFVMSLETLYFTHDPVPNSTLETGGYVWPVFFKIDGATAQVSDAPDSMGKLMGTATVSGTTGVGPVPRWPSRPRSANSIGAEPGDWP
jgi:hypothetical protein